MALGRTVELAAVRPRREDLVDGVTHRKRLAEAGEGQLVRDPLGAGEDLDGAHVGGDGVDDPLDREELGPAALGPAAIAMPVRGGWVRGGGAVWGVGWQRPAHQRWWTLPSSGTLQPQPQQA